MGSSREDPLLLPLSLLLLLQLPVPMTTLGSLPTLPMTLLRKDVVIVVVLVVLQPLLSPDMSLRV